MSIEVTRLYPPLLYQGNLGAEFSFDF
jgi:hypothetical protein